MVANRSWRRCFLILRCWLFLSLRSRTPDLSHCSPMVRELGSPWLIEKRAHEKGSIGVASRRAAEDPARLCESRAGCGRRACQLRSNLSIKYCMEGPRAGRPRQCRAPVDISIGPAPDKLEKETWRKVSEHPARLSDSHVAPL